MFNEFKDFEVNKPSTSVLYINLDVLNKKLNNLIIESMELFDLKTIDNHFYKLNLLNQMFFIISHT